MNIEELNKHIDRVVHHRFHKECGHRFYEKFLSPYYVSGYYIDGKPVGKKEYFERMKNEKLRIREQASKDVENWLEKRDLFWHEATAKIESITLCHAIHKSSVRRYGFVSAYVDSADIKLKLPLHEDGEEDPYRTWMLLEPDEILQDINPIVTTESPGARESVTGVCGEILVTQRYNFYNDIELKVRYRYVEILSDEIEAEIVFDRSIKSHIQRFNSAIVSGFDFDDDDMGES